MDRYTRVVSSCPRSRIFSALARAFALLACLTLPTVAQDAIAASPVTANAIPGPAAISSKPSTVSSGAAQPEALFYAVPSRSSLESFQDHAARVALIAPQCFALDRYGVLRGSLPPGLTWIARQRHVEIMPLVINAGFSRWGAHHLLHSAADRDRAVGELLDASRAPGVVGYQLDFEGMSYHDRPWFTRFVQELARSLHRHGKLLSVAVAARTSNDYNYTYATYSGVYDYRKLANAADFLSVMAYPESDKEHPGPLASYPWVQQVIQTELQYVPAAKLSLGMPDYQTDFGRRRVRISIWRRIRHRLRRFFRWTVRFFAHSGPAEHAGYRLHWDPVLKSSYRVYGHGRFRHIVWVEDERSFQAKLSLVKKYHLRGFSVWRIGLEDPHIWAMLPRVDRQRTELAGSRPAVLPHLVTVKAAAKKTAVATAPGSPSGGALPGPEAVPPQPDTTSPELPAGTPAESAPADTSSAAPPAGAR